MIVDSYVGVFPLGVEEQWLYQYGVCDIAFITSHPHLYAPCNNQSMLFRYLVEVNMAINPLVPYAFIQVQYIYNINIINLLYILVVESR